MLKGIYILNTDAYDKIYGPQERADIAALAEIVAPQQTAASIRENLSLLSDVEVILSGWGAPLLDEAFLAAAPNLRAFFYGAGTIRYFVTDAFWAKGIPVTSSYAGNAVPVAEYTLAQILFSLKRGWQHARDVRRHRDYSGKTGVPGAYGSTVGLVSLGMIGRMVCRHLQRFDLEVIAYDPFASEAGAAELGVELCSLEDIFRRSDVVSLHTPWLPETVGMITGEHFASMKQGATFINTSRGAVVREPEMIDTLQQRPDLFAVLDVVWPEPPAPDSPLYTLDNVVLTPHIAGSMNNECRRMGQIVVEELRCFVQGEPLRWAITREQSARMA